MRALWGHHSANIEDVFLVVAGASTRLPESLPKHREHGLGGRVRRRSRPLVVAEEVGAAEYALLEYTSLRPRSLLCGVTCSLTWFLRQRVVRLIYVIFLLNIVKESRPGTTWSSER